MHPEENQGTRTGFQRDRDRIIHSKAFRRLGYKTQVFVNSEGDMFRTRLTHSMEVAQLSRSVCSFLGLNTDYAEALALAHDMGHSPFGHAGQDVLNRLMQKAGGFEHNCQTLRIVTDLESRYIEWNGLNLTRLTILGMMKHARVYECDGHLNELCDMRRGIHPPLEAVIVDVCDRLAYLHHDFEDGLDAGFLVPEEVMELLPFAAAADSLAKKHGERFTKARFPLRARTIVRQLIHECVSDLLATTEEAIRAAAPADLEDIFALGSKSVVGYSREIKDRLAGMHRFLTARLYKHPQVLRMSRRGENIISQLFSEYSAHPHMMPAHHAMRVDSEGVERVVSDYVSGMTDRFAEQDAAYLQGCL
jgi:dGTPase